MFNAKEDCTKGRRVARGLVCRDPFRPHTRLVDGMFEERLRHFGVPPLRKVRIDHLPILINRTVDIGPAPLQTDIRLINAPVVTNGTSIEAGSFAKQREEALDPSVDRAAVNDETTLRKPFHHIGVA